MANEEHLAIIRQGVEAWNQWREANPTIQPDLSRTDLRGTELEKIDLLGANLSHADLTNANLSGALLMKANLEGANLSGTNFSRAYLREAQLHDATFFRTNFAEAFLERAVFGLAKAQEPIRNDNSTIVSFAVETIFMGCNFSQAVLASTYLYDMVFTDTNFEGAILEFAGLSGASLVGANLAHARLRKATLRGTNLEGAVLTDAQLQESELSSANFTNANLTRSQLHRATAQDTVFQGAVLTHAICTEANFTWANFGNADLSEAVLSGANLSKTIFARANLEGANLSGCVLVETNFREAQLRNCAIYGISAWNIELTGAEQANLTITRSDEPTITVDDLEVAQFIYLLLNRKKVRNVINTITSKAVLVLGRFTPERKVVLDAMADELRKHNLLPIIFDFEGVITRDVTETIKTLAGLSLFVIADITNPKSAPLELQATVPDYQIPFIAIMQEGERPFAMFSDLPKYPWLLTPVIEYPSVEKLLQGFKQGIIDRAWAKHQELVKQKNKALETQSIEDFVQEDEG